MGSFVWKGVRGTSVKFIHSGTLNVYCKDGACPQVLVVFQFENDVSIKNETKNR